LVLAALMLPAIQSAREAGTYYRASAAADAEFDALRVGVAPAEAGLVNKSARYNAGKPGDNLPTSTTVTAGSDRKIIYTATIQLVAEDFAATGEKVVSLVKQFDGYVADSNLLGASGHNRRASWKIRVPIARFDEFIASAKALGELTSANTTSQDVSEEYVDVDARIRNKTKEEERLLKLLEDRPGKLEDVIAIERELSRVREDLERMQGRMRVLADRTSLTTVQLEVAEVHNYVPAEAPTFATRIRRALEGSIESLREAAEGLVVTAVALAPWLAVLAVIAVVAYPLVRRMVRHTGTRAQTS
jgi:hypothetical protein